MPDPKVIKVIAPGPQGPPGPGTAEDWHFVGDPGEPDFFQGKRLSNMEGPDVPAWGSAPSPPETTAEEEEAGVWPIISYPYTKDAPVGFYKDQLGIVHLRGAAVHFGAWRDEARREGRMFVLPVGYRPDKVHSWEIPVVYDGEFTNTNYGFAVMPDGTCGDYLSTVEGKDSYISSLGYSMVLDVVSFRAAA